MDKSELSIGKLCPKKGTCSRFLSPCYPGIDKCQQDHPIGREAKVKEEVRLTMKAADNGQKERDEHT